MLANAKLDWPQAIYKEAPEHILNLGKTIFSIPESETSKSPLKAFVRGTAFQVKVWRALLHIPAGNIADYSSIAKRIGTPKASRAVGTAIGKNPIAYLIPCHQVIRQTGGLGDYRWGTHRKQALLIRETAR